jgi:hypothetical protein
MRIREIITEQFSDTARGFSDRKSRALNTTWAFPGMPSSNPYRSYRFAMAMANHEIAHEEGPTSEFAVISAYSKGDEEIVAAAIKATGEKAIMVADRGSNEPDSTSTVSPVAKKKRNRWGV